MLDDSYRGSEFGLFYVGDNFGCDNDGDGRGDFADGVTCTELAGAEADTRPKFTATYTPNDNLTLFAVQSAGYRPGGNNLHYHISVRMILKQLLLKEDTPQIMQKTQSLVLNTDRLDCH